MAVEAMSVCRMVGSSEFTGWIDAPGVQGDRSWEECGAGEWRDRHIRAHRCRRNGGRRVGLRESGIMTPGQGLVERWTRVGEESWQSLAERTANRIRLLQADLADEDPGARRAHVADEVRAALSKLVPDDQERFLEALEDRFPAWEAEGLGARGGAEAQPVSVSPTDLAEFNDAGFLIRQLQKLAGSMSAERRAAAAEALAEVGIGGAGGVSPAALDRLRAALEVGPEAAIDLERAVQVMATVLEKMLSLDDIAWKNWMQISENRRRGRSELAGLLGRYVTGDGEVGSSQVGDELESFRRLAASLMLALSQSGEAAYKQMRRLHPDEIEGVIRNEKGSVLVAQDVRCWRRYRELAGSMDAAQVEREVLRSLAGWVNDLMSRQSR
jgi:hypothetical protein